MGEIMQETESVSIFSNTGITDDMSRKGTV